MHSFYTQLSKAGCFLGVQKGYFQSFGILISLEFWALDFFRDML